MRIDRALNLVIPVERDEGAIYVHAAPISQDVFDRYFLTLSKTFTAIYAEGLKTMAGPRVAALMLKRIAMADQVWEGDGGVEQGLVAEWRRLAAVISPGPAGWSTLPMQVALNQGLFSEREMSEVDNAIAFFIVNSALQTKSVLPIIMERAGALWGTQTTSLTAMDWAASLRTSTPAAPSGETVPPSSIAY